MGVRASLRIVSSKDFNDLLSGNTRSIVEDSAPYLIDKSWYNFHESLSNHGPPLSLAITGDCLSPMNPISFDDFQKGDSDYFFGLMSPLLVNKVAQALGGFGPIGIAYEEEDLYILKQAYNDASLSNSALSIMIV